MRSNAFQGRCLIISTPREELNMPPCQYATYTYHPPPERSLPRYFFAQYLTRNNTSNNPKTFFLRQLDQHSIQYVRTAEQSNSSYRGMSLSSRLSSKPIFASLMCTSYALGWSAKSDRMYQLNMSCICAINNTIPGYVYCINTVCIRYAMHLYALRSM